MSEPVGVKERRFLLEFELSESAVFGLRLMAEREGCNIRDFAAQAAKDYLNALGEDWLEDTNKKPGNPN